MWPSPQELISFSARFAFRFHPCRCKPLPLPVSLPYMAPKNGCYLIEQNFFFCFYHKRRNVSFRGKHPIRHESAMRYFRASISYHWNKSPIVPICSANRQMPCPLVSIADIDLCATRQVFSRTTRLSSDIFLERCGRSILPRTRHGIPLSREALFTFVKFAFICRLFWVCVSSPSSSM